MKIKVASSQFNYQYGDQIHFPYSIAMLVSYIQDQPELSDSFEFQKTFVFRDKLDEYVDGCKDVDVLLCSCYVWNWEVTTSLAKKVRQINPNCFIIFGGPQVPNYSEGFFDSYPFVDMLVHGEGERVISNVLKEYLGNKDYSSINGIEVPTFRTPSEERIRDLETIPSPYLSNLVWDLVEPVEGVKYIASWETNRGCPFQCTFCDWGSATKTKVRKNPEERLFKEIEWFADNKIPYVDCCDANFGIFADRDFRLAKKLKEEKIKKNYPERIRPAWAKASSEKIIPIAKELQSVDLLRAVTLAVQSLDDHTLKTIKRKNIKFDRFSDLTKTFRDNKIPTYTEIILGLPGETLSSYKRGLEELASLYPRPVIYIYNCGVFPNAPMNVPEYIEEHQIKKIQSPIFLAHSSIHDRGMKEYEDIVISAETFSKDDLKIKYLYGWMIQTFHSLGIFEYVSKYYNQTLGMKFVDFYGEFIEYCKAEDSFFSKEYNMVVDYIEKGYDGKGWNHYDEDLGDIYWPMEEATWIRFASDEKRLFAETEKFLNFLENKNGFNTSKDILRDLISFQTFLITTRDHQSEIKSRHFKYDWKGYLVGKDENIEKFDKKYYYDNLVIEKDKVLWGWKCAWWGRGSKKYKFYPEHLRTTEKEETTDSNKEDYNKSVGIGGV
tara:strand:- start:1538 stop:3526 length:1989 start_codon:yes stop_codon:yes gene_type:complete